MVNRLAIFAVFVACGSPEPRWPAPPKTLGSAVTIDERSAGLLAKRPADWVFARRWTLDGGLAPKLEEDHAAPLALARTFHAGPLLGWMRCDVATCAGALKKALPDGAERAHLEQRILRTIDAERVDGIAVDLAGLDEVDSAASAFVEELGAVLHLDQRKLGVIMRMTCRDVVCTGARLLGRVARASDIVVVEETQADVVDEATRSERRRRALKEAFPNRGPTARVFLSVVAEEGREERDRHGADALAVGFGGLYLGDLTLTSDSVSRAAP